MHCCRKFPDHRSVCAPDMCGGPTACKSLPYSLCSALSSTSVGPHRGVLMPIGTVKWFDPKKGFGFLQDEAGQDVFIHYTVIEGDGFRRLWDGEQVEYEFTQGPKGLLASKVRRINPPP